jgi:predicted nucleic acid-binding protein
MASEAVVVNASLLTALFRIEQERLLQALYREVCVPGEVAWMERSEIQVL